MKFKYLIALFIISLVFSGCIDNTNTSNINGNSANIIDENNKPQITIKDKSPKEVFNIINNDTNKDIVILDVRTPEEYNSGHLKGAILINYRSNNFKDEIDKLDKNKHYIVYCRSGSRSIGASYLMKNMGFKNITNLKGGILQWKMKLGNKLIVNN